MTQAEAYQLVQQARQMGYTHVTLTLAEAREIASWSTLSSELPETLYGLPVVVVNGV